MHRSKFIKFLKFPVTTVPGSSGHPGSCWVLLNFITLPDVSSSGCRHQVRRTSVALMFGLATASISTVSSFARYTFPGENMTSPSAPFAGHSPHQSIKPLGHQITSGSNLDHLAPGCTPFATFTTFSGAVLSGSVDRWLNQVEIQWRGSQ